MTTYTFQTGKGCSLEAVHTLLTRTSHYSTEPSAKGLVDHLQAESAPPPAAGARSALNFLLDIQVACLGLFFVFFFFLNAMYLFLTAQLSASSAFSQFLC